MKARVRTGRLVLDEPSEPPEGTEVDLVPTDWWDAMDDDQRQRLEQALERSQRDVAAGRVLPADVLLDRLRPEA